MTKYDAIYARQSVDRVDSISIESQIDICKREVYGDFQVYSDKGYSGKNTDRPAWQQLLADVRAGKISRVITYRLDRISRSVLDFANIIDIFGDHNVEFISTMEKFDTGSPIGKAMVMIVMVFAQLERETIQQRVIDAYQNRSEKGFYMGGQVPFGYRLIETAINGVRTKMYEPDPVDGEIVKMIFQMYSDQMTSFGDVVRELNRLGVKNKNDAAFTRPRIRDIIINPVYIKADMDAYNFFVSNGLQVVSDVNDFIGTNGCYLYDGHNGTRKQTSLAGHKIVLAPHLGLVEADLWITCRKKCMNNKAVTKATKAKNTWLAGKIKCKRCGYAMSAKITPRKNKDAYEYLVCSHRYASGKCDGVGTLPLREIETTVFTELKHKLMEFSILQGEGTYEPSIAEKKELEQQISHKENEIEQLIERLLTLSGAATEYVNGKINQLDQEKKALETRLDALIRSQESVNVDSITDYVRLWDDLSFNDKRTVVDTLIESIHADKNHLDITWKI